MEKCATTCYTCLGSMCITCKEKGALLIILSNHPRIESVYYKINTYIGQRESVDFKALKINIKQLEIIFSWITI